MVASGGRGARGGGANGVGDVSGGAQSGGERHRKAGGVRGGDQLLGVGFPAAFKSRTETVGARKGAGFGFDLAAAFLDRAFPFRFGVTDHEISYSDCPRVVRRAGKRGSFREIFFVPGDGAIEKIDLVARFGDAVALARVRTMMA